MTSDDGDGTMPEIHERVSRKFERHDANHLDITIECQGETYDAVLEDISPSGVRIKCDDDLPERGSIKVVIPKGESDEDEKLMLKGILRWTNTITEAGIELTRKTEHFQ